MPDPADPSCKSCGGTGKYRGGPEIKYGFYNCYCTTPAAKPIAEGKKYDTDKPRFDLIPPLALLEVAKVLTHGAKKYDDDNWRKLDNLSKRYLGACGRHINAVQRGESKDSESGLHHLAHAICCLMFILEKEQGEA